MNNRLSIITFNCFGALLELDPRKRFGKIAEEILKLDPDIVLLQEVITVPQLRGIEKIFLENGYISGYTNIRPFILGGLVLFSRIPFSGLGFEKYSVERSFHPLSITDSAINKGFQHFHILFGGKKIKIFNTHLLSNYSGTILEEIYIWMQLNQLIRSAESSQSENLILAGDFNFPEKSFIYNRLISKLELIDPLVNTTSITFNARKSILKKILGLNQENRKIDYTLLRGFESTLIKQEIVFSKKYRIDGRSINLSDHYGIRTVVNLVQ